MTDTTREPTAPVPAAATAQTPPWLRFALAALAAAAVAVHVAVARERTAGLLEHDESISLLVAGGSSARALTLYAAPDSHEPAVFDARTLQSWMRIAPETGFSDVARSLRQHDIHPPLYFWLLHAAQRAGIGSETLLRLIGTLLLLAAAFVVDRCIWPMAPPLARLFAAACLLLSPATVESATELRQYALVGFATIISIAVLLWRPRAPHSRWKVIFLVAVGPALLVYAHFGTAVWVLLWLIALAGLLLRRTPSQGAMAIAGVFLAALICAPLIAAYFPLLSARSSESNAPGLPIQSTTFAVLKNLGRYFATLPWRLQSSPALLAIPGLVVVACIAKVRRLTREERSLLWLSLCWAASWIVLLSIGRLPPHAVDTKYLLPGA